MKRLRMLALVLIALTMILLVSTRFPSKMMGVGEAQAASPITVISESGRYFLQVDLQDPRVDVRAGLANNNTGGYETLSSMQNRFSGFAETALINADYFGPGCPSNVNC